VKPKVRVTCPFCSELVRVTPAGKFELHPATDRWKRRRCRGSGELAHMPNKKR
jgi:hypothetical protein